MAGIQFEGSEAVLRGYENRDIAVWACFAGRALNCAGNNREELAKYLEMIEPASGNTTYTLKVYAGLEDADQVDDRTPSNGEFNFKLNGYSAGAVNRFQAPPAQLGAADIIAKKINERIGAVVEKELDKMFSGNSDEEEEEETLQTVLMGLLKDPNKLIGLIQVGKQLFGSAAPVATALGKVETQPIIMGRKQEPTYTPIQDTAPGVNNQDQDAGLNAEEIHERLTSALNRLEACDPKILEHLEKLAEVAEKKPAMYKMALEMLNNL